MTNRTLHTEKIQVPGILMKNEKVEGCDTGDKILRSRGGKKFGGNTGEDIYI
jgi:hypothetical protein